MYKVSMLLGRVKAREYLHFIDDFSILLGLFALKFLHLFQVKQTTFNDEFLATDALVQPAVVQLDDAVFEFNVLWCVVFEELHVGEK